MDQWKEFLQRLDPKGNLFCGNEMIMQTISVSCVKVSCAGDIRVDI